MSLSPYDGVTAALLYGWRVAVPAAFVVLWAGFAALPGLDAAWRWPLALGVALFAGAGAELAPHPPPQPSPAPPFTLRERGEGVVSSVDAPGTLWLLPTGAALGAGGWLSTVTDAAGWLPPILAAAVAGTICLQTLEVQGPRPAAAVAHGANVVLGFALAYLGLLASGTLALVARVGVAAIVGAAVGLVVFRTIGGGRRMAGMMALAVVLLAAEAALAAGQTPAGPALAAILVLVALYSAVGCCGGILGGAGPRRYAEVAGLAVISVGLARIAGW